MAINYNWIQIYNWVRPNLQWKQKLPELYWTFDETTQSFKYKYNNTIYTINTSSGGGTSDHALLTNLAYAQSGHTGFEPTITAGTTGQYWRGDKTWQTLPTISTGNLTEATSSVLTITGGTNAVVGAGTSIQVKQASGTQDGFLSSTNWTTFNNKQNAYTILSTLGALANANGYLLNDGSGVLSWGSIVIPTQYWSRTGTILSPVTANDSVSIGSGVFTGAGLTGGYVYPAESVGAGAIAYFSGGRALTGGTNLAGGETRIGSYAISTGTGASFTSVYTAIIGSSGTADNTPTEKARFIENCLSIGATTWTDLGSNLLRLGEKRKVAFGGTAFSKLGGAIFSKATGGVSNPGLVIQHTGNSASSGAGGYITLCSHDGAAMGSGNILGGLSWHGMVNTTDGSTGAEIQAYCTENSTGSVQGTYLAFLTKNTTTSNLRNKLVLRDGKASFGNGANEATSNPSYVISINGTAAATIGLERHATRATAGSSLTISSGAPKSGETNLNGGDLILSSAISTGTGTSNILFYTATAGASGTTDRTPTKKWEINGAGYLNSLSDSWGLMLGAGSDASIIYDGTNMVINPKVVGTGCVSILGVGKVGTYTALRILNSDLSTVFDFKDNGSFILGNNNVVLDRSAGTYVTTVDTTTFDISSASGLFKVITTNQYAPHAIYRKSKTVTDSVGISFRLQDTSGAETIFGFLGASISADTGNKNGVMYISPFKNGSPINRVRIGYDDDLSEECFSFKNTNTYILDGSNVKKIELTTGGNIVATGDIKGGGFKSSDGSAGVSGSFSDGVFTITVKNGLITNIS